MAGSPLPPRRARRRHAQTPTQPRTRVVQAWAITSSRGSILEAAVDCLDRLEVFTTKRDATKIRFVSDGERVVPCEIRYTLPPRRQPRRHA